MGDLDDALSSVSFIRGDENGPSESGLLWSYLNPLVLDVLSILRDLGNPLNVSLVATDSFVPAGSASPGDLLVSTAMSRSFRERQANVQSCWCHSGWRHGVSKFKLIDSVTQGSLEPPAGAIESDGQNALSEKVTADSCFVTFKAQGKPDGPIAFSFEEICDDFYGSLELHDVFGSIHTGVAVLCTIPRQGLTQFVKDLVTELLVRFVDFEFLRVEVPSGWNTSLVEQWYYLKSDFVDDGKGHIIASPQRVVEGRVIDDDSTGGV